MKRAGLIPPALENKEVQQYVNSVAQRIAQHSDLKVPLHVTILQSKEINAFALPGGYLFIQRGLLEAVDDDAELAGVIAHELAPDTTRHAAKLMKRATMARAGSVHIHRSTNEWSTRNARACSFLLNLIS